MIESHQSGADAIQRRRGGERETGNSGGSLGAMFWAFSTRTRQGSRHCWAKQCHALDLHSYAGKPKERTKGAHDQWKQKMLDTYEAYALEVKGAQQALGNNQD